MSRYPAPELKDLPEDIRAEGWVPFCRECCLD